MAINTRRLVRPSRGLDLSHIDFAQFRTHPLPEPVLRCLRYMHDIEHHTVCYLRDLLVTQAHRDAEITTFLTIWNYEEHWHGEAIGQILAAHGEIANDDRVLAFRHNLGLRDHFQPLLCQFGSLLTRHIVAVHMAWGAINEWTTQAAYQRLGQHADHPALSGLLQQIMRQEGRHVDFYMAEARRRMEESRVAQFLVRNTLTRFWKPVGSGIMPQADVRFLITYLFGDNEGFAAADRIDRRMATLPGLEEFRLVRNAIDEFSIAS